MKPSQHPRRFNDRLTQFSIKRAKDSEEYAYLCAVRDGSTWHSLGIYKTVLLRGALPQYSPSLMPRNQRSAVKKADYEASPRLENMEYVESSAKIDLSESSRTLHSIEKRTGTRIRHVTVVQGRSPLSTVAACGRRVIWLIWSVLQISRSQYYHYVYCTAVESIYMSTQIEDVNRHESLSVFSFVSHLNACDV